LCDAVRDLLRQHEDSDRLADLLEAAAPYCACETDCLGHGSPGPVGPAELLHRIISSPRDYDPVTGTIRERPFHKVFGNGVSVWRAMGPDEDIAALAIEALTRKSSESPKSIKFVLEAATSEIRDVKNDNDERVFCVYDQTVNRLDEQHPPVPTHASIFQRYPPPGTQDRKTLQKDLAGKLREIFERRILDADAYRNGLCAQLNARAVGGDFVAS
jgi:hypothetical protein